MQTGTVIKVRKNEGWVHEAERVEDYAGTVHHVKEKSEETKKEVKVETTQKEK